MFNEMALKGQFAFVVKDENGNEKEFVDSRNKVKSREYQSNLLLDNFFRQLNLNNNVFGKYMTIRIGTGATPPAFSDTKLDQNYSYSVGGGSLSNNSKYNVFALNADTGKYESYLEYEFKFSLGSISLNMSELGMEYNGTLISRALVKDQLGEPTTITVTDKDELTIYYRIDVSTSYEDIVYNVDVDIDGTITPTEVTTRWGVPCYPQDLTDTSDRFRVHPDEIKPIGQNFSSGGYDISSLTTTGDPDTGTTWSTTLPASRANFSEGISSMGRVNNNDQVYIQFGFNPPIMKTDQQTVAIAFGTKYVRA